ncbi:hypothetical protein E6B08_06545 [Pseudomonas putida]|uniref:Uncharacterized protein n=1 Tax=Pseudomonas putida TaxID=303 RepID=A0A4D6XIY5_PSEPU|nr:hypothetical protein E6B08_06545 [Pseudomonas putida]
MAPFHIFVSTKRQARTLALLARFSSARRGLYTVPVQFREIFRGVEQVAWRGHCPSPTGL